MQFRQALFDARQISQSKPDRHRVEGRVSKGQAQRIAFRDLQHWPAKIDSDHARSSLFKYRNAQIAGAASDIEDQGILSQHRLQLLHYASSPTRVDVR